MKNVIKIIEAHGGLDALKQDAICVDPPSEGFMRLCVEYVCTGVRRGTAFLSIAHYYEAAGDLVADPEVVVQVPDGKDWKDERLWEMISFAMPGANLYQGVYSEQDGKLVADDRQSADIKSFLRDWDRNIGGQGFVEAFKTQRGKSAGL